MTNKIKITIVEDEALIADHIALCLEDLGYEVAAILDNGIDLLEFLKKETPDLILMDIQIQGEIDGVDLAHKINKSYKIPLIFITSNTDKSTIERVKITEPAGFIVKPYTIKDLASNIEIALYKYHFEKPFLNEDKPNHTIFVEDAFFIKEKSAFFKLKFKDILYVEANDNYSVIYTISKKYLLSQTLKSVEGKLLPYGFIRVHRSYLVNMQQIDKIEHKKISISNKEIPLSDSYKEALMDKINLF